MEIYARIVTGALVFVSAWLAAVTSGVPAAVELMAWVTGMLGLIAGGLGVAFALAGQGDA